MYLDDIVRFCLPHDFPGHGLHIFKARILSKFTKDAEMEIDKRPPRGPAEKIAKSRAQPQKKGAALRVLYDAMMPEALLQRLVRKLRLDKLDTIQPSGRYQEPQGLSCRFLPPAAKTSKYPAWPAAVPPELKETGSLMKGSPTETGSCMYRLPETFDYVVRLLQEAAVSKG